MILMGSRVAEKRKQCAVPGCIHPGRLFSCGWRCDVHRPGQVPTPDPSSTAVAIRRSGYARDVARAVANAMLLGGLTAEEVIDAARSGVRQHELHHA